MIGSQGAVSDNDFLQIDRRIRCGEDGFRDVGLETKSQLPEEHAQEMITTYNIHAGVGFPGQIQRTLGQAGKYLDYVGQEAHLQSGQ
jgi:hypothetical protein